MTEKRFKLHIKWYNIEKTEGKATLTDNGQPLIETEQITDARLLKNILNDLYNENEQLKNELTELKSHIVEEKVYYPSSDECFICECGRELIQKESFKKNKPLFVCNDCGKSYFREEIKTENILWKDCCGEIHKERPYITERKWKE